MRVTLGRLLKCGRPVFLPSQAGRVWQSQRPSHWRPPGVPDPARIVEVHTLADEVRIFEDGTLIAAHPVLEGRHQRRVATGHRKMPRMTDARRDKPLVILRTGDVVAARPLDFYEAVGRRLAYQGD